MSDRRTKRRYAHELYPHAEEGQTRPLATEVPYLYARAVGLDVWGTSWAASFMREGGASELAFVRMVQLGETRRIALLADALFQGLSGDEAWAWADGRYWDESGELVGDRAVHYGVPVDRIKPYPCGPEPDHHNHYGEPNVHGWRRSTRVDSRESDCPDCTEDVTEAVAP